MMIIKIAGLIAFGLSAVIMWALCAYSGKIDEERGYDE